MDKQLNLLKKLCLAFGPSCFEGEVASIIKEEISGLCDEISEDRLGNVYATIKGSGEKIADDSFFAYMNEPGYIRTVAEGNENRRPKLMIAAHMDEVGFLVQGIDDNGYIKVITLGGIDKRVVSSHKVELRPYGRTYEDGRKSVTGTVLSKPIHLGADVPNIDRMSIDIGAKDKAEAEKYIAVGDFGTFDTEFSEFGENGGFIKSKAIDDRLGCAAMIETMRRIKEENLRPFCDLCFVFTVREEIGMSGAGCAAYKINPDVAVVLESTAIADIANVKESERVADVGGGGVLSLADRSTVYNAEFVNYIFKLANENSIKCQLKRFISGGNDAGKIHLSRGGVKCAAISAPCRYLHTSCNVIDKNDYFSITDLVFAIVKNLK